MSAVFISYSTKDQNLADFVYRHLEAEGVEVFMAAASLQPGQDWTEAIKQNLRASKTVIVLASKQAIASRPRLPVLRHRRLSRVLRAGRRP